MKNPEPLWAKSKQRNDSNHPSMFLSGHLADVLEAATHILDATGDEQLQSLRLDPKRYRDRFRRCVRVAAALHDTGKANDHFQSMILGSRNVFQNPQGIRHEWVSVLILRMLKHWLLSAVDGNELDFAIVEWAIAGHHPASSHQSPPNSLPDGAGPEMTILTGHNDLRGILNWLRRLFSLASEPPKLNNVTRQLAGAGSAFLEFAAWSKSARRTWQRIGLGTPDAHFVAAVKACLIAADVAGSALPKAISDDASRLNWITRAFSNRPDPGDIQKIADHRLKGDPPREFQQKVAASRLPVTYVKAG